MQSLGELIFFSCRFGGELGGEGETKFLHINYFNKGNNYVDTSIRNILICSFNFQAINTQTTTFEKNATILS